MTNQKVISSFYFLDNDLQLQKIVTSKNVISAIHEQELNGLIRADIELDLSYSKFLVAGIDYVGYHYKDNFYLHKIQRVEHDHVDEITKVVLRHIFFEDMLYGKIIKDIRPVNREASYVLRNTIDTHSRWRTFMTDVTGSLSTNFYWQVMYEVIEFVTENYRIEYLPVLKFDGQKVTSFELHAANRIGEDKNIRIPFGSRVLELKYDVDYSEIVTRLVGHGKGEEVGDGYGRRIDFKDINFNKNGVVSPIGDVYMEDESITAMYGNDGQTPREGRIVFEDIEDPKELANETYNHYLKVSRPQMLFTADVADIGDVGIGDSVLIIRREHDVYFKARIHKLSVDLLNPSDAQVELGDYEHYKHSKIERVQAKKEKNRQQQTNNRIESLKRQFDTEFDAQVDEFRKEFEQKLIDVNAQIQAEKEAFELQYEADKEALSGEIQDSYTNAVTEANRIVEAKEIDFKNYADGIGNAANGRIDSLYDGLGDLSSEFESLEIGGRNYLKRSDLSGDAKILADGEVFKFSSDGTSTIHLFSNLKLKKGKYIYHIMMKKPAGDSVAGIRFHKNRVTVDYYGRTQEVDGEWNRIEIPFEVTDESDIYGSQIYNHAFGVDFAQAVEVMHPMIGKGNKPTDWTPAPEDTDQKLTIIANNLDGVQTKVENNTGAITTVTQQANGLETRVENAEGNITTVTELANGIQQRVTDAEGNINTVTQLATGTQQRVTNAEGNINTITNLANGTQQTVTNMLNGKATKGTVFQNTVDGFLNRVWQTDIDKLNFENRNLLKKSNELYENNNYNIARYYFDVDIKEGEEVTVSLKGQLGSDRTAFVLYNSGGYVFLVSLYPSNRKDGIYTATFNWRTQREGTVAENTWLNVFQQESTGTTASKIEWIKLEKDSKATPYSVAPEDLMKYTDIVARPDGFLIGSFEMGGDKIAQAIVGKAGAIDLIAQNVNFTGNVNVANQIKTYSLEAVYADIAKLRTNILTANSVEANALKVDTALINKLNTNSILTNYLIADTAMIENIKSKSLEAVYADISELRTRLLVADVITANMVKFDTALIEKFTSSTAFINSLTAKSAFINNVKAIDITASRIISEFDGDNTTIQGGRMTSTGRFDRTFDNGATASYISRVRSANGVFLISTIDKLDRFGNSMLNTDWTGRGLFYSEKAIGTQIDNFARSSNRTGRYIDFYSSEVYTDGYTGSGMEIYSDTNLNIKTGYSSNLNLISDSHTWLESYDSIWIRPARSQITGDNTFRFYVYDGKTLNDKDGLLSYGSTTSSVGVALRFSKNANVNKVSVINPNDFTRGIIEARTANVNEVNAIDNYLFLGTSSSGEVRAVKNYNLESYSSVRAANFYGNFLQMNASHTGSHLYLRTYSGGEVRITQADTTDDYRNIRFHHAHYHGLMTYHGSAQWFYMGLGGTLGVRFTDNNWADGGYKDIQFKSWLAHSSELAKHDIEDWNYNVLDRFRNDLKLSRFRFNNDENKILQPGIIVHVDPRKDTFPVEWRRGDSFNGNVVMWWTVKGVQELAHENDEFKSEITELKSENDTLKSEIAELKSQINKIMEMIA